MLIFIGLCGRTRGVYLVIMLIVIVFRRCCVGTLAQVYLMIALIVVGMLVVA